ncbi:hypothetical protein ABLE68_07215 [Nocardioides sp. CN2-186]|uniref:site-specific integrase n=1 Tax=Nocardioides tweenelious TaxID=3156607 RepID=UPI0032B38024
MRTEVGVTQTGGTYRVQRKRGDHSIRASFETLAEANAYSLAIAAAWAAGAQAPSPEEFASGYATPTRSPADPSVPTRLNDLVEAAIIAHQTNKHLDEDGVPKKQRGQWRTHGLGFFTNPDVRNLTRARVQEFSIHLYEKRLDHKTANEHLRLVRMACGLAMELGLVPANVATGVMGRHQDHPLQPRDRVQPRPLTVVQVKVLAAQFPSWLQLAVFLMYVACLRLSEAFGIELRDWNSETQTLRVRRQGGLKKNEGKRDPFRADAADGRLKNRSSRRTIPVPSALAEIIDLHIEANHGPRPTAPTDEEQWLERRLIRTPGMPKPRNTVIVNRWENALRAVGLDYDTIGFKIDRHFLRKSGSTVIGIGDIRGKLWSAYLGHQTPAEFGGSLTTVRHYFDLPDQELIAVADRWEGVIREEAGDLLVAEEWTGASHMTMQEVAQVLGVHETHVGWLLQKGHLLPAPEDEVASWRNLAGVHRFENRIMVAGPSVHAEAERRHRRRARMTEKDVARELATSVHYVKCLRARGCLLAEKDDDGSWVYEPRKVAQVAVLLGEENAQGHLYMAPAEAAAQMRLTQHQFERVYGDRVGGRTLLLTQQRQYLRADVEVLNRHNASA